MLRRTGDYLRANALAAIALFVALGGTSYAVTGGFTSKNGRLEGCVGANHVLKLIKPDDHCTAGQAEVVWQVAGPVGPPGRRGPTGKRGPQGDRGENGQSVSSTVLAVGDAHCPAGGARFLSISGNTFTCNGASGPVGPSDAYTNHVSGQSVNLPAGDYVVFGWYSLLATTISDVACGIEDSKNDVLGQAFQSIPGGAYGTVSLAAPVSLSSPDSLKLVCLGAIGYRQGSQLSALHVETLHTQ